MKKLFQLISWARPLAGYFLVFWVMIIIYVSSIPSLPSIKINTGKVEIRLDYFFHFFEYGVLAFLAFLSFTGKELKMSYRKFLLVTACLILFAILDEFHQKLIQGRSFNYKDIASNIIGIIAVMVFCILLSKKTVTYYI
jgi:VanZ family protein